MKKLMTMIGAFIIILFIVPSVFSDVEIEPNYEDGLFLIKGIETGPYEVKKKRREKIIISLPNWIDVTTWETETSFLFRLLPRATGTFSICLRGEELPPPPEKEIIIYPNPVKGKGVNAKFINLPKGEVEVKIFNIAGELVFSHTFFSEEGMWEWDLKNNSGNYVASGIYIYVIKSENAKNIGKFAIIK